MQLWAIGGELFQQCCFQGAKRQIFKTMAKILMWQFVLCKSCSVMCESFCQILILYMSCVFSQTEMALIQWTSFVCFRFSLYTPNKPIWNHVCHSWPWADWRKWGCGSTPSDQHNHSLTLHNHTGDMFSKDSVLEVLGSELALLWL